MSHQMTSAVLACFYQGGAHRMLAFAVADACPDASGERMFRSVPTLAHMAMISHRSVQRGLASFVAAGWLELAGDRDGGRGRSTVYRISSAWITDVAVEQARARVAGELPKPIWPRLPDASAGLLTVLVVKGDKLAPFTVGESVDKAVDNPLKGDNLSPFAKTERVTNGDLKGDKFDVKGDIAVSPEHYEQNTTNTPLIPQTGEKQDFPNSQKTGPPTSELPKPGANAAIEAAPLTGFSALMARYPRKRWRARKTRKEWRVLAPDAALQARMFAALDEALQSAQWQEHFGQYVPNSDRWLQDQPWATQAEAVAPPPRPATTLPPPVVLTPAQLATNRARAAQAVAALKNLRAGDAGLPLMPPRQAPTHGRGLAQNPGGAP